MFVLVLSKLHLLSKSRNNLLLFFELGSSPGDLLVGQFELLLHQGIICFKLTELKSLLAVFILKLYIQFLFSNNAFIEPLDLISFSLKLALLGLQALSQLVKLPLGFTLRVAFLCKKVLVFIDGLLHVFELFVEISLFPPFSLDINPVFLHKPLFLFDDTVLLPDDVLESNLFARKLVDLLVFVAQSHFALHLVALELLHFLLKLSEIILDLPLTQLGGG